VDREPIGESAREGKQTNIEKRPSPRLAREKADSYKEGSQEIREKALIQERGRVLGRRLLGGHCSWEHP
jgi:hypothetical protein